MTEEVVSGVAGEGFKKVLLASTITPPSELYLFIFTLTSGALFSWFVF